MRGNIGLIPFAVSQPLFLLIAWVMGLLARKVLRGRALVTGATMTVVSVLGISLGLIVAALIYPSADPWTVMVLLIAFVVDVAVLALASAIILSRRARETVPDIADLLTSGESEEVEFKSSARWNMRTHQRDERLEKVVAKTVAAFLNSTGGSLLLGVDDAGVMLGLSPDFSTLRSPDADRFELWLRDLLQTRLGPNAAALPSIDFLQIDESDVAAGRAVQGSEGALVCRIRCSGSPVPVYLKEKTGPEMWVRVGNSTRTLALDDAVRYIRHRWPATLGSATRDRLGARFRGLTVGADPQNEELTSD